MVKGLNLHSNGEGINSPRKLPKTTSILPSNHTRVVLPHSKIIDVPLFATINVTDLKTLPRQKGAVNEMPELYKILQLLTLQN